MVEPAILETVPTVEGRLLPARILESNPRKALRRGVVMILRWLQQARGIRASRLVGRFSHAALVVAGSMPTSHLTEERLHPYLRDYSTFCRLTSALWHLRHARAPYREMGDKVLGTENLAAFSHEEFALFIASQLRATGLAVSPTPRTGEKRPDLHASNALVHGGTLYWECKERNPDADRDPLRLVEYFRRELREGSHQIRLRENASRGIVSIDTGITRQDQRPPQHAIVEEIESAMAENKKLIGVSISGTFLFKDEHNELSTFTPAFRSQLRLSRWALEGRHRLRGDARDAILHAMPYAL